MGRLNAWSFATIRSSCGRGVENLASERVAEKVGFRREGVLRSHMPTPGGSRRDSVLFSLLPGELREPAEKPVDAVTEGAAPDRAPSAYPESPGTTGA